MSRRRTEYRWESWSQDDIFDLRFCDLGLTLSGTPLERMTERLSEDLKARGIDLGPSFWLSTEFFTPDGVLGIALPFYLAHPKLKKIERAQCLEVEGGSARTCMKILRHEAGHVVQNAYEPHRRRKWREHFGRNSQPYPEWYRPRPRSKRYVQYLDYWYAQSHPAEDWAETFAVWLTPRSNWRRRYRGWPALQKIEYVDELMKELAGTRPHTRSRRPVEPLSAIKQKIGDHYAKKREAYEFSYPTIYDRDLRRLFSDAAEHRENETAVSFIRRNRVEVRRTVSRWTQEHAYTIDLLLRDIIGRCRELDLHLHTSPAQAREDFIALLTMQTVTYLYSGKHVHAM